MSTVTYLCIVILFVFQVWQDVHFRNFHPSSSSVQCDSAISHICAVVHTVYHRWCSCYDNVIRRRVCGSVNSGRHRVVSSATFCWLLAISVTFTLQVKLRGRARQQRAWQQQSRSRLNEMFVNRCHCSTSSWTTYNRSFINILSKRLVF